jgi:predicted glycosyltransferase involved in capsule biosynthesis
MTELSLIVNVLESYEVVRRQLLYLGKVLTPECELIVIDDGSAPSLEETCNAVAKDHAFHLHCTRDRRPWTQPRARNIGAALAVAPRLLFFDIDHILTHELIARCLTYPGDRLHWRRRPGALNEQGRLVTDLAILAEQYGLTNQTEGVHGNSFFIRKELFQRLGGYDERYCGRYGGDDLDFNDRYERLCRAGHARPPEVLGEGYYFPDPARLSHLFHSLKRNPAEPSWRHL